MRRASLNMLVRDMADKVAYGAKHSALLRAAKLAQV